MTTRTNKATEDYNIRSSMSCSESDAVSSEYDEDSDDFDSMESDEGEVGILTVGALRRWMRALEAVVSEDDDAFSETEDDAAAGDSDSDDAPRNTGLSDCFEKRSKNLAALPTYNMRSGRKKIPITTVARRRQNTMSGPTSTHSDAYIGSARSCQLKQNYPPSCLSMEAKVK